MIPVRSWDGRGWDNQRLMTTGYGRVGVEATPTGSGFFARDQGVSAAPCARGLDLTCWVMGRSEAPATYMYHLADVGVGGV